MTYDSDEGLLILGRAIELMREEKGVSVDELVDASGVPGELIAARAASSSTRRCSSRSQTGLDMPTSAIVIRAEQLSPPG